MPPYVSNYKSAEHAIARERILNKLTDRCWDDEEYRKVKNEETKKRSREIVICAVCEKSMCYGSIRPHKNVREGFKEPTPLELLTKCMIEVNLRWKNYDVMVSII